MAEIIFKELIEEIDKENSLTTTMGRDSSFDSSDEEEKRAWMENEWKKKKEKEKREEKKKKSEKGKKGDKKKIPLSKKAMPSSSSESSSSSSLPKSSTPSSSSSSSSSAPPPEADHDIPPYVPTPKEQLPSTDSGEIPDNFDLVEYLTDDSGSCPLLDEVRAHVVGGDAEGAQVGAEVEGIVVVGL